MRIHRSCKKFTPTTSFLHINSPKCTHMTPRTYHTQLRYWSIHCCINALPSFLIAFIYLGLWKQPHSILAMILGVLIFIILYTGITTEIRSFSNPDSLIYKASKVAIIFRAITAFIALILVPTPFFFMTIDYFAGFFAGVILGFDTHNYSFFETLIWTLFEGLLLSIFLFTIALVILGLMKLREILYRDPTTK